MDFPLIGITTSAGKNAEGHSTHFILDSYVQSISRAGGLPVLIPLKLPSEQLDDILKRLDGVLFTGGGDVNPARYRGQNHPKVGGVDDDRDRVELELFKKIRTDGMPFFGICRGIQVINVAMGGTLYEDIADQYSPGSNGQEIRHDCHMIHPRDYLAHKVRVEAGSQLEKILGRPEVEVNSLHHQGIMNLAEGLRATAWAPDGLIEGFELTGYPFGLAVQWHPEWLQAYEPMQALFSSFIQAAQTKKQLA